MKNQRIDIYQTVTDSIIEALENGANGDNFVVPWHRSAATGFPLNLVTGKEYSGINVLHLWVQTVKFGFTTMQFASYKQWQSVGANVRKGEKGQSIIFFKPIEFEDNDGEMQQRFVVRRSTVFNLDQVEGYEADASIEDMSPVDRDARIETFITHTQAEIHHAGQRAFYHRVDDAITLPDLERFDDKEDYYRVLLHELVHWTGHASRTNRRKDLDYPTEELVADLGSAMLCASLGISPTLRDDHAQYVAHWLEKLRDDKRAIFRASSMAQIAVEFIYSLQPSQEKQDSQLNVA